VGGQEDGAGVAHALEAFFRHGEDADLVDGTKPVLDGAHQAVGAVGVALEVEHRVDDVFEHAGAGQRAFLGDMAHQHDGRTAGFGGPRELGCAFTDLGHRAGRGTELVGVHRLDGIDDGDRRPFGIERGQDLLELDLGLDLDLRAFDAQAPRTHRHLGAAFFAGDVERRGTGALEGVDRLEQQGRLADAGIAADEDDAAGHDAAAQHAVELVDAGGGAVDVAGLDVGQRGDRLRARQRGEAVLARPAPFGDAFDECVPGPAAGAFAEPAGAGSAAFAAHVVGLVFCHAELYGAQGLRRVPAGRRRCGRLLTVMRPWYI